MKKLSSSYGHHLQLINNSPETQSSELSPESDSTFNQRAFQTCDIVGNFDKSFIIIHWQGKFYLVDQHAASEKSLYIQFIKSNKLFPVDFSGPSIQIENIYSEVLKEEQ